MRIYLLPIINTVWDENDQQLLSFVSEERQRKVKHYRFDIDKKLSLYSALLVRMELSKLVGIPAADLKFFSKPLAKPLCLSALQCHFSFSHTRNMILSCISERNPVGADIEMLSTAPLEIVTNLFHPDEIDYVMKPSSSLRNLRFYKIWTQKEAYVKYLGTGLSESLSQINMLDPTLSKSLVTWKENDCICSVFQPDFSDFKKAAVSEQEIFRFYLSYNN